MSMIDYQCSTCFQKYGVIKDTEGRLKREFADPGFDNPHTSDYLPSTFYYCPHCKNALVVKTIRDANRIADDGPAKILRAVAVAKANLAKEPENAEMQLSLALLFLSACNYTDAIANLNKAKEQDPLNASIDFLLTIAMLNGHSARTASRQTVKRMEELLETALAFETDEHQQALYKCLYAYILYDFYESRNMMSDRDCDELAEEICNSDLTQEEIYELFKLLKVSKPAALKF